MPEYKVTTDKGAYKVTLDKEPSSEQELQQLVEQQLAGGNKSESKSNAPKPEDDFSFGGLLADIGKKSAIPTALGIGGGLLAGPLGESAGSVIGTGINQLTGIEEPSLAQLGMAAVAPQAGRVVGKGLNAGLRYLGKTFAGREAMSEAADSLFRKWMSPVKGSKVLYNEAEQQALGTVTPTAETGKAIDDVLSRSIKAIPTEIRKEIIDVVDPLEKHFYVPGKPAQVVTSPIVGPKGQSIVNLIPGTAKVGPKPLAATVMMDGVRDLRAIGSRAIEDGNADLYHSLNNIRAAMLNDLEKSGVPAVREAAKAYRKEMALDDLSKLIGKPFPLQKINDFIKDNGLFKGAFEKSELDQITRLAKKMGGVTASGGRGVFGKVATGALGLEIGGIPGMIVALGGEGAIQALFESPFGRNYAERILSGSNIIRPQDVAAIATFARGLMAKRPTENRDQQLQ